MWIDGALRSRREPAIPVDDGAYLHGRGCYTTTLWTGLHLRHGWRSAERLARDAHSLGIGTIEPARVTDAMEVLARAAFGTTEGIVRMQASVDAAGALHLVGIPRALGADPDPWTAVSAPFPHPGPAPWAGAKVSGTLHLAMARDHARTRGADECILCDAEDRVIEGARTNLFVVRGDGAVQTPPLERGAVAGLGRAIVLEALPEIVVEDLMRDDLRSVREIVATNAVRGARGVVRLDGAPVGAGVAGPLAEELAQILSEAPEGNGAKPREGVR